MVFSPDPSRTSCGAVNVLTRLSTTSAFSSSQLRNVRTHLVTTSIYTQNSALSAFSQARQFAEQYIEPPKSVRLPDPHVVPVVQVCGQQRVPGDVAKRACGVVLRVGGVAQVGEQRELPVVGEGRKTEGRGGEQEDMIGSF